MGTTGAKGVWVAAFLAAAAPACGGRDAPGPAPECSADADCGSGETCRDGTCASPLQVSFAEPAAEAWTNGRIALRLEVAGAPETVALYDGATLLATLSGPGYRFVWDTASAAEGLHAIRAEARAGGASATAEVAVHVDRTPPRIAARTPAPGASGVCSRDPIRIAFDEPVAAVPEGAVLLADARGTLSWAAAWSADGKTLTITPGAILPVPNTLALTVSGGIVDRAGNALLLPPDPRWTWDVPAWLELGTGIAKAPKASYGYVLALDAAGAPIVGYRDSWRGFEGPWRWSGTAWDPLGDPAAGTDVSDASLVATEPPALAWSDPAGTARVSLLREDGWTAPAVLNSDPAASASDPVVASVPGGGVVVAWLEGGSVPVKRWDGAAWASLGSALSSTDRPSLALDAAGAPVVLLRGPGAWSASVWRDGAWQGFASCGSPSSLASGIFRVARSGAGFVAAATGDPASLAVYACSDVGGVFPALGDAFLNAGGFTVGPYSMELTPSGRPVIAWIESGSPPLASRVLVRRWAGDRWEALGGDLVPEMAYPEDVVVSIGPDGRVAVGVTEYIGGDTLSFHVLRYNE